MLVVLALRMEPKNFSLFNLYVHMQPLLNKNVN